MTNWKTGLIFAGAIALGAASMWAFLGTGDRPEKKDASVKVKANQVKDAASKVGSSAKKIRSERVRPSIPAKVDPPKFDIGASEEAKLTEAQAKLLAEIRAALKADKKKEIVRLIRKLQAMEEWPDGIPKPIKLAALEALGWCGASGIPELLGFLGDADPSIVSTAADYWEDAIAECDHDVDKTLSDGTFEEGLATHVKNASKVIYDAEVMESVLEEINSGMRHSVAVETIKQILESGNDVAKKQVMNTIEELTDDSSIKTAEQLDEWLKNNPDDSDDNIMYGGDDDTSSSDDD